MISRRGVVRGLAGLVAPTLAGCGRSPPPTPVSSLTAGAYPPPVLAPDGSWRPAVDGLDAVIDISHNVQVSDFRAVRSSGILAVVHKTSEGGDWSDPSYAPRRQEAEAAGLLWGGYHFGTRQYSGARQAEAFLSAARPGPTTLLALDYELNDYNPSGPSRSGRVRSWRNAICGWPIITSNPKCPMPGPIAAGGSGSTLPTKAPRPPPMARRRAPFPASPTATATCSPATRHSSPVSGEAAAAPECDLLGARHSQWRVVRQDKEKIARLESRASSVRSGPCAWPPPRPRGKGSPTSW